MTNATETLSALLVLAEHGLARHKQSPDLILRARLEARIDALTDALLVLDEHRVAA